MSQQEASIVCKKDGCTFILNILWQVIYKNYIIVKYFLCLGLTKDSLPLTLG
jgi:hypothetical protein